ncbi:MAG TPA: glycosyltransferase family 4 protein [Dermatophilaceae bacterium]|nr:glycosyltransferase family 4 protein [Dermatophilaceae bacterium]
MAGSWLVKVALLSDCYPPRLGGIEVQVHDLADRLRQRGHEVHVFTATPDDGADSVVPVHGVPAVPAVPAVHGVPVHRLSIRLPFQLPVNPFAPPALRRMLQDGRFDVAHVHMGVVSPFAVDCTRVTLGLGLPTAMTWHCMLGRATPLVAAAGYVRRWAQRGVAMSAVSSVAAAAVQRAADGAGTVSVLPNGLDLRVWRPAESVAAVGGAGVQVVTAMRLAARKRPLPVLRTLRRVRALVPSDRRLRLVVLGEGPARGRLERYLARHDMTGWVDLPGRVPREQLRDRYAAAHLYISPARLESFGIAALEARAVGLPVVSRTGSGVGEFVADGVDGLLAADDEAMAVAVARLVTDDALRERIAAHNRAVPPAQSWDQVVRQAEQEYERARELARSAALGAVP